MTKLTWTPDPYSGLNILKSSVFEEGYHFEITWERTWATLDLLWKTPNEKTYGKRLLVCPNRTEAKKVANLVVSTIFHPNYGQVFTALNVACKARHYVRDVLLAKKGGSNDPS